MIDGVAIGDAGFARLGVELSLHAHTYGRYKLAQREANNWSKLAASEAEQKEAYQKEMVKYSKLYEGAVVKVRNKNKWIGWLLFIAIVEGTTIGLIVR